MKRTLIALAAAAVCAAAAQQQPDPFKGGGQLQEEIDARCQAGCVVFNRVEAAQFEQLLDALARANALAAYQLGAEDAARDAAQGCRREPGA